jgi:hypothetical protein
MRIGTAIVLAVGLCADANTQRAVQDVSVKSADGAATVKIGDKVDAASAANVILARLTDDDPAVVVGTHYRVSGAGSSWPDGTTLEMRWELSGVPGGATPDQLVLARRSGNTWTAVPNLVAGPQQLKGTMTSDGEYAVRWQARSTCSGQAYHALDFRLGVWDYRATGYTPGRSNFTADPSGCAFFDHYIDEQGGRSTSLFVRAADGRWRETTYDPGGRAVLTGEVERDGVAFYHSATDREVYRSAGEGVVIFSGERSADGGRTWATWVTARYTKVRAGR